MRITFNNNYAIPFIALLLLPVIILLLPIAYIGHLLDKPAKKKRHARLTETIATKWKLDNKYVYICYAEDWNLASQLEQMVVPKYKDYLVIDSWSDNKSEWTHNYPDDENRVTSIVQDIFEDYDGVFDTYIGFVDPERHNIDTTKTLSYMRATSGFVHARGRDITAAEAIDEIDSAIRSHLKSQGVLGE